MGTYRTTIEVDVVVTYNAYPFIRGSFEPGGLQIEPDEPARIEVELIETANDTLMLTGRELENLRQEIAEYEHEHSQPQEE